MKDSLKKGLIIGAAGSAICVLWHHLLTKKMMQLAMDRVAPQDRSNGKMRVSGSPEMIETTEIVKKAAGQLEKSGCDVVEITAHDGISLHWALVSLRRTEKNYSCHARVAFLLVT